MFYSLFCPQRVAEWFANACLVKELMEWTKQAASDLSKVMQVGRPGPGSSQPYLAHSSPHCSVSGRGVGWRGVQRGLETDQGISLISILSDCEDLVSQFIF